MTGTREPQQDGSIQAMLRDSGLESAAELRSALEQLRAVVPDAAPAPRADLAALLAAAPAAAGLAAAPDAATTTALPTVASAKDDADEALPAGVTSLAERRGRKRRLAIVGGAVVGAMTLGAGAVAASSEDFRYSVSHSVGRHLPASGARPPGAGACQPVAVRHPGRSRARRHAGSRRARAPCDPTGAGTPSSSSARAPRRPDTAARHTARRRPRRHPADTRPEARSAGAARITRPSGRRRKRGQGSAALPGHITPTLPGVVPTKAPGQP